MQINHLKYHKTRPATIVCRSRSGAFKNTLHKSTTPFEDAGEIHSTSVHFCRNSCVALLCSQLSANLVIEYVDKRVAIVRVFKPNQD